MHSFVMGISGEGMGDIGKMEGWRGVAAHFDLNVNDNVCAFLFLNQTVDLNPEIWVK